MFVVFYTVNLCVCVLMTCSTFCCLYETLWIRGMYVCMQHSMFARKTCIQEYNSDISSCPIVGHMPLSSAWREIVYILKRNWAWAININLNPLQALWIRWMQGKICFIKMKINYIKNSCHLFNVFNVFLWMLGNDVTLLSHVYWSILYPTAGFLCSLMLITGMRIKNKNDGITQKLITCSKLLQVSSDVFV
jgi:hypothetical protein